jgi:hypothetical protein
LEGAAAERARAVSVELARSLAPWLGSLEDPTLSGGLAGAALLADVLTRAKLDRSLDAEELLARAFERVGTIPLEAGLFSGVTGVAWAAEHLFGETDDLNEAADALVEELLELPGVLGLDLVSGIAGLVVYLLERPRTKANLAALERCVDRLAERSETAGAGVRWPLLPSAISPQLRARFPNGAFDLGVAHGHAGLIAALALATDAGIARARPLLERAVPGLLAFEGPTPGLAFDCLVAGNERSPSRAAWCYGDPGVAHSLLLAGRAARRDDWTASAVRIGLGAAALAPERSGVTDPWLCHGAAGLAHVFARLFHATGEPRFGEAARRWLDRVLAAELPAAPELLTGRIGVALVLLAASTPLEPLWDRHLLLS